jgi:hypothetical protein
MIRGAREWLGVTGVLTAACLIAAGCGIFETEDPVEEEDEDLVGLWVTVAQDEIYWFDDSLCSHIVRYDVPDVGTGYLRKIDEAWWSVAGDSLQIYSAAGVVTKLYQYAFDATDTLVLIDVDPTYGDTTVFVKDTAGTYDGLAELF